MSKALTPFDEPFDAAAQDKALDRYLDLFILADTRIAFGNATSEDQWMAWHQSRTHASFMIASLELANPAITRYSDVLGQV